LGNVPQPNLQALCQNLFIIIDEILLSLQVQESHFVGEWRNSSVMGVHLDPTAETVADIVKALNEINPAAAEKFIELYLGDLVDDGER
jgi:hypothetical protein